MKASKWLTRRRLFWIALQALAWTRTAGASTALGLTLEIDRLLRRRTSGAATTCVRRYRVHATVSLLSVPLFSRYNVGGACAVVEEIVSESSRTTILQFFGGSWPDRVHGFNRFGMTQEAARENRSVLLESAYLSFITTSDEKSLEEARKAFVHQASSLAITVAHGLADKTGHNGALDHLSVPAGYTWSDCPRVIEEIRGRVSPAVGVDSTTESVSPAFLYTVRKALADGAESARYLFIHNARPHWLRTKVSRVSGLTEMCGWISECGSRHETAFRVWLDPRDETQIPIRIEFRPKSFLCLVFEHDPAATGPVFQCLLSQEQA